MCVVHISLIVTFGSHRVYVFEKKKSNRMEKNKDKIFTVSFISAACLCNLVVVFGLICHLFPFLCEIV